MKRILTIVAGISSLALCAVPASAQSYNKRDPHFNNVPGCPANSNITVNTDKFSDGTPLPSCGGRVVSGTKVTTWKMVWTGTAWATVGGSIRVDAAPAPPPSVFRQPSRADFGLTAVTINSLPQGKLGGQDVYLYQGNWVTLVAAGGGNYTTKIIAAGGGNLVAAGGGNIVSTNGGNILLNGGANITRYTQAMRR